MSAGNSPALLFEQLKSFSSLARTLNLSRTVRDLGTTRQTVRRHIALLEEMKGESLFRVEDRQYHLTEAGERSLREAEALIARGEAWLKGESGHVSGLYHLNRTDSGNYYYLQQHPMRTLWEGRSPLLAYGLECWSAAKGRIEAPEFAGIRPWLMIFRRLASDWICVEVGEKSSYATWYGWEWERSSVGRGVAELPGGTGFANLLSQPFHETATTEGIRLDHILTKLRRGEEQALVPISYERLLMGCYFPDGSTAIAALINRTHDIFIEGLPEDRQSAMPAEFIMEFSHPTR